MTKQQVLAEFLDAIWTARWQRNPGVMIAGAREIGKLLGLYEPEAQRVELMINDRGLADLGKPEEIGCVFAGFQKFLYQPSAMA